MLRFTRKYTSPVVFQDRYSTLQVCIISINNDPDAPINQIADYVINGDVGEVLPKMIKYYKQNSK